MSTKKLVPLFTAIFTKHSWRGTGASFLGSFPWTPHQGVCKRLQPANLSGLLPASQFTSSPCLGSDKKFGQFMFGRPPKPDLAANELSIDDRITNIDPLSKEILLGFHHAETPKDLFQVFRENKSFMNEIHTSRALQQLADMWDTADDTGTMVTNQQNSIIASESDFRDLCIRCLRDARHMDDFLFLRSLQSLLKIGVPENSALIHTLLTHSSYRLDQMSAPDFAIFCQILISLRLSSELSHALNKAVVMIIPEMIAKADRPWHLLTYLDVAGQKLSETTRGRLFNKLLALLKLEPLVTSEDCLRIAMMMKSSNFQSEEIVKELCEHLQKGFQELTYSEICQLIQALCHFRYVDLKLIEEMTTFVCQHFEEELDESALCNLLNGLTSGRIYHPEVVTLGCRHVIESLQDSDLSVNVRTVSALAKYMSELNLRPVMLQEFVGLASGVYEDFFSREPPMKQLVNALDGFYHFCLLNDLKPPFTKEVFEDRAAEFIKKDSHRGKFFNLVVDRISVIRSVAGIRQALTEHSGAPIQLNFDLPHPWHPTQYHILQFEKRHLRKALEELFGSNSLSSDVGISPGLKADFILNLSQRAGDESQPSDGRRKVAVNILPRDGQAANRKGHLIRLYHLKDGLIKHLGYSTLWVDARDLNFGDVEGEAASDRISELKAELQRVL